jgi:hypothetical protein
MADRIDQLPPSMEKPTKVDTNAMNEIFENNSEALAHVAKKMNWKNFIIPLIVFIVLSLPPVDTLFLNMLSQSEITALFAKTAVFLIISLILQFMT